ncbi:MAG: recombination mediator RecR [Bacteroidales bacterium]|jgi:recombination protein RecR|nr:recombination mediator RecR [Bacteroidales bacterium]
MNQQLYSSKLLENVVNEFSRLPGIGKKTALRMALYLLKQETESVRQFGEAVIQLRSEITYCKHCLNLSDSDVCDICSNPRRDHSMVCVVESIRDVMSIENTMQYQGVYHVLGGVISPMDGIGPSDLTIDSLENKVKENEISEIILALSTTMEGDTTNFYIYRKLKDFPVKISTLARGVSIGDELEYADQVTLGRSIINRQPFEDMFNRNT